MAQQHEVGFKIIRISDKGQIAIPVDIRRELGLEKGDELLLIKKGEKIIQERPKNLKIH